MVNVALYVLIMLQKTEPIYNVYFSRYSKKSATIFSNRAPTQIIVAGCKSLKKLNVPPAKTRVLGCKKPKKLIVPLRLFER